MNLKKLTITALASASLLVSISASANVTTQLATSVTTRVSTLAVNLGVYSSASGALGAAIANQKEFSAEIQTSMDRHGQFAIGPVKQVEAALKALTSGKARKDMTQEEALSGLATILQAIAKLSDVNTISGVSGQKLNMKDKVKYFDNVTVAGLDNAQEEAVLAGIVGLIQGGYLVSGIQSNELSLESTKRGIALLNTFIEENNYGDVQASLAAFSKEFGEGQAVGTAKKVAVSCGSK